MYSAISDATMKALLVILLAIVGLAKAEVDQLCEHPNPMYTVPHPTDCSKFILCQGRSGKIFQCEDGTFYNDLYSICTPAEFATCSKGIPEYVALICNDMPIGATIPAVACDKYYICNENRPVEVTCPYGQHYSRAYSTCINPIKAGCQSLNRMCIDKYPGYSFPSLACENYYSCNDNLMPELKSCQSGLSFSPRLQKCVLQVSSECIPYTYE